MSTTIGKNIPAGRWHLIDAKGKVLGRLATKAAVILMGKHRPYYTRERDTGDHVVVINASQIKVTGRKMDDKVYKHYSGYPSGLKEKTLARVVAKDPTIPVKKAIRGMLPKSSLGYKQAKKLFVYAGETHPHQAQKCEAMEAGE